MPCKLCCVLGIVLINILVPILPFTSLSRYIYMALKWFFSEKRRYDVASFGIVGKHPFVLQNTKWQLPVLGQKIHHFQELSS